MNRNILQIISLCLCAVLLVVCIRQGVMLKEFREQLSWEMQELQISLKNEINSVSNRVESALEESNRIVEEAVIWPVDINVEEWTIMTFVSVTLKEWYDDTEVILLAERDGESRELPLSMDGDGRFSGNLTFSLDEVDSTGFYAQIRSHGKLTIEDLYLWTDYSQLLPLYSYGSGWTGPDYADGMVSSQFNINIESQGRTGEKPLVYEPEFRVYKNGELVQTLEAMVDIQQSYEGVLAYTVNTAGHVWQLEMAQGDTFEIRFLCQDAYGLGYDFLFMSGELDEDCTVMPLFTGEEVEFRLFRPE